MIERTVYLHGDLGTKFIDKITIYADSIHRVMGVLGANFSDFKEHMIEYTPGFHVRVGDIYRDNDSVQEPLGSVNEIHIIPAIAGSGGGGKGGAIFAIVLGAILIMATGPAGVAISQGATSATVFGINMSGAMIGFIAKVGVSLVLQGVSALLFTPDKPDQRDSPENTPNTYFNGAVNTIAQGNAVSIGYGTLLVGSAVISAGLEHETI